MSFWKSLKQELGKNTAKWASNLVFKEKWSTPYRFNRSLKSIDAKISALKAEQEQNQSKSFHNHLTKDSTEEKKINDDSAKLYKSLLDLDIKNDKQSLLDVLEYLTGLLNSLEYQTNIKPEEKKIFNLAIEKMDIALYYLNQTSPEDYPFFNSKFNKYKKNRLFQYFKILLLILLMLILSSIVYII